MLDLRSINRTQFLYAKRFWMAAISMKLVIFALGVWAVFLAFPPRYIPQILLVLAIFSEILQLRSDEIKSQAESLLRTLDLCRSFGREISAADKRNMAYDLSRGLRKRFTGANISDDYFKSTEVIGPQKAIENLLESAWYTRRQVGVMVGVYILLIAILLALSVFALIVALRETNNPQIQEQLVKVVTAWLLLIVSLNMIKAAWSYFKMYQRCQKTEFLCEHLLRNPITEADAVRQWYEYQMSRASSPLLPEWLWRIMKPSLDDAWRRSGEKFL
jgi:hypothetical protein